MEDSPLQALQGEIETKASELERYRANELELTARLGECEEELKAKEQTVEQVISDCQAALRAKTAECEKNQSTIEQLRKETAEHSSVIEQLRKELHSKTAECERNQSMVEQLEEPSNKQEQSKEEPYSKVVEFSLDSKTTRRSVT